ncbi:hypothetical protein ZYGR_0A02320 [Zygosaccharomyces rouxii]|uniref:ZYRO0A05280p n=2 Tax=Zygosaccharomyces rouxii TaxID=4956 RepID=C5DPQ6_ZYGRC|nr:uncharacterized protein ZYRO0A05280g [Zygosaccharomyces rouxii]KAH9198813.1 Phosphomethylpyrimidine kinase-domain-containing protein [Zygosaccharomyces rouxii]GAV46639.1 hypothetical protein ZYGR_0A02320 [Zygosaccharomyces rouxii]CAR25667.1 ZYRO0A05280p [Zygosaccharomyces rouxii]
MTLSISINTPPPYLVLNKNEQLPVVMTVAGSDSSGGAGIEADIKTITAHRCYAMTCMAALTAQTPAKVYSIHPLPKEFISQVLDANLKDMNCDVIKTGMLTANAVEALAAKLDSMGSKRPKLVIDPVLVATSGSALSSEELIELVKEKITPLADLLTPNIYECFKLIGSEFELQNVSDLYELARRVSVATKSRNILVKGGHIPWGQDGKNFVTDVLYLSQEDKFVVYNGPRILTTATHGTGCTLASAIASNLARGYPIAQAVYGGIEYVQSGVSISCQVASSHIKDNGPINHVYAVEVPLEGMVQDECFTARDVIPSTVNQTVSDIIKGDFFEYLISHPKVKPHWESYIHHDFVRQVAQGTLPIHKFQFFIEQDYAYLLDYARVHCIAGSKAPSLDDVEKELVIVGGVKNEMSQHEKRLKQEFGVSDNSYFDRIERSQALKAYSRYFNDVAKRGNWQELVASLSPCLMGYGEALLHFRSDIVVEEGTVYREWCDTYLSPWYVDGMEQGKSLLNQIARTYPADQLDNLVSIYANVCELETNFWGSALEHRVE